MIAVLVPVLGRGHQIQPLLASLKQATSTPYRALLICSPNDKALAAAKSSTAELLVTSWSPGKADYAKKLALGYQASDEPWLFQGATDLRFYPGWDIAALKAAERFGRGVVGTNDLGNALVKRGKHSTHSLISRDYLEQYGGTSDNSGLVFSEAYDHQFSDVEFVETAQRRRQFISARNSIVEHLHVHWGKAPNDKTYEKAMRATDEDRELFMQRRQLLKHA